MRCPEISIDIKTYQEIDSKDDHFAARYNVDPQPNVWVGKIAHGSYDNWCDGHGLVRDI